MLCVPQNVPLGKAARRCRHRLLLAPSGPHPHPRAPNTPTSDPTDSPRATLPLLAAVLAPSRPRTRCFAPLQVRAGGLCG